MRRQQVRGAAIAVAFTIGAILLAPTAASASDPSADLWVSINHAPSNPATGELVTFVITVPNKGDDEATGVVVGIGLPDQLSVGVLPEDCRRGSTFGTVVCQVADVEPGFDAGVELTVTALGSGSFTVPVAVTAATSDPDPTNQTATDTLVVKPGERQGERYVDGIFSLVLGRAPDPVSRTFWADRWRAEGERSPAHPERVPYALMQSDEHRRVEIRDAYQRILARDPDATSVAYWVSQTGSGWTIERIERALIESGEFGRQFAGGDVEAIYDSILGRGPTSFELDRAHDALDAGSTRAALAGTLQRSTERLDQIIVEKYQEALGHPPSDAGRDRWRAALRRGTSVEQLWSRLLVLDAFLDAFPATDVDLDEPFVVPPSDVPLDEVIAALAEA